MLLPDSEVGAGYLGLWVVLFDKSPMIRFVLHVACTNTSILDRWDVAKVVRDGDESLHFNFGYGMHFLGGHPVVLKC
jgi:hypothetical protein